MKWRLVVTPKVQSKLPALPPQTKRYVRQALDDVRQDPRIGKPLRDELLGLHSFRVKRFRIVYQIRRPNAVLLVVGVGRRETIYEEVGHEHLEDYTDERIQGFLVADRLRKTTLPASFRSFFWDVPLSNLSFEKHRDFILERLLEWGDQEALRWVLQNYSRATLEEFLRGRGREVLPKRNWKFWSSLLGAKVAGPPARAWRRKGRRWGGVE